MSDGAAAEFEATLRACEGLLAILARLRAPDGCPWDRKQTLESMAPLVLEEAFELADAVAAGRASKIAEEMGDLFMNVFMSGMIAEETSRFTLKDVFEKIAAKLINRHPHVFGDARAGSVDVVLSRWEEIKKQEREANDEDASAVAGVPRAMPGLLRAFRVGEKLKRTGADLPPFRSPHSTAAAALSEWTVLEGSTSQEQTSTAAREDVVGRVLLALCNAAVASGVNPEMALRRAVDGEEAQFRRVESALGAELKDASGKVIDEMWAD